MSTDIFKIERERYNKVTESNEFLTGKDFKISAQEKKILLYIISKIGINDTCEKTYSFSVTEFCNVSGLNSRAGSIRDIVRSSLKKLYDKSVWVKHKNGDEELISLFNRMEIKDNFSTISLSFHKSIAPFLFDLKENFTSYELIWALGLKSKYAIRLYEIACSIHYNSEEPYERYFPLDELQRLMWAETYTTFQSFKERALIPAIDEINSVSNKWVECEPVKESRKVVGIKLHVENKNILEVCEREKMINKQLNEGGHPNGQ